MRKMKGVVSLAVIAALGVFSSSIAQAGASKPEALDLGALSEQSGAERMSVTIALELREPKEAENLMVSLHTPGDPQYHRFLTADQFAARFAPIDTEVARIAAALGGYGLTAERTSALTLKVTGRPADMERAFAVSLHSYQVPAHGNEEGYTFHAPLSRAAIPPEIAASVSAVVGLDSRPSLHPHIRHSAQARPQSIAPAAAGNPPGLWTVADLASYYDVLPLYSKGLTGKGRTLAIVTLANFTPSDVFAYWSALGLPVDPDRLQIVNIDGGPGAPSDASGSRETTLDVEQSGGLAPGAHIIVYLAPNTNQAFLDAFVAAVESNAAQSVSTSWGFWEWFNNLENSPVTDPVSGQTVGETQAMHEQFVRAAIQGQSLFTSSGDNGAYEANGDAGCFGPYSPSQNYSCSLTLSVNYPASDSAITAAGGTTLAGSQVLCVDAACTLTYTVNVPQERVWGWDYLIGFCQALGLDPISCGIYPAGSGGGVSVFFGLPGYQSELPGVGRSQPDQVWQSTAAVASAIGITATYFALPEHYSGRNVPDVSLNADPDTGYVIFYTPSATGVLEIEPGWGGTSFVAPQLNGIAALLGEDVHSRLGLLNFPLYAVGRSHSAYKGPNPVFHAIRAGDNWFYTGSNGYNLGVGLGTLDVGNFERILRESD